MIQDTPLLKSGVSERIWNLQNTNPEAFKREVKAFFALGYPGWTVVRAKHPHIYLRDDRNKLRG
ncbi:hypothetical protein BVG16_16480 [Paenibacillus selenitireducens]|uniref:Uncharacterized protein n=1 Tax=Paenibacillus selenitireducens TaxID=1324314 RepID=A0A1T2XAQ3_9BACL|nr:hypothetical protein BVG16_16480 [Paenibacillus selenitireducens]